MSGKRLRRAHISAALLAESMMVPENAKIIGCKWDEDFDCPVFLFESEEFTPVPPGKLIPLVQPTVTRLPDDDETGVKAKKYRWDWNL